jgi:hypothetical protein
LLLAEDYIGWKGVAAGEFGQHERGLLRVTIVPTLRAHAIELCGLLVCALLGCFATSVVAADDEVPQFASAAQAQSYLMNRGLTPVGNVWITGREKALRRWIESLPALERRHQRANAKSEELLAANETKREQLAKAEAAEQAAKKLPKTLQRDSSISQPVSAGGGQNPSNKLKSSMPDVTGLGEQTPLQAAMIELVTARLELQSAVLNIQRAARMLDAEYRTLQGNATMRAALRQLGGTTKLGPIKSYQRDVQRAESLVASVFGPQSPGYFENGQFHVGAVLNDTLPALFEFRTAPNPVILAHSVAERLGITENETPQAARSIDLNGRRLSARPITLASIRLGNCLVRDVPALVLPPEAEDLGSQLNPAALVGYQTIRQERRMLVNFLPQNSRNSR